MTDTKLPKNVGWSFVEYFNKNKPVYTQNDVESFLKLEMAEVLTTIMKFPKHEAGLSLKHNEHHELYEKIAGYIEERRDYFDDDVWATQTSKQRAIETDSLWVLHWYPNSPVGFNVVAGATLEEVLKRANEEAE